MLEKVIAHISCDECGKKFTQSLDPAERIADGSGFAGTDGVRHFCPRCDKKRPDA